jgi:hypothetical protein
VKNCSILQSNGNLSAVPGPAVISNSMKDKLPEDAPRKISIFLGTGTSSRQALDVVLPLLEYEAVVDLQGVFVEEVELQKAAKLPFVKELSRLTSSLREFHTSDAKRQTELRVRAARRTIAVFAGRAGVTHSFRNLRGSVIGLLKETASVSDITVFEPIKPLAMTFWSTTRHITRERHRIAVIIEDLSTARETMIAASILAQRQAKRILIFLTGQALSQPEAVERMMDRILPDGRLSVQKLPDMAPQSIVKAIRSETASALVIATTDTVLDGDLLQFLREELRCPVFLIRRSG